MHVYLCKSCKNTWQWKFLWQKQRQPSECIKLWFNLLLFKFQVQSCVFLLQHQHIFPHEHIWKRRAQCKISSHLNFHDFPSCPQVKTFHKPKRTQLTDAARWVVEGFDKVVPDFTHKVREAPKRVSLSIFCKAKCMQQRIGLKEGGRKKTKTENLFDWSKWNVLKPSVGQNREQGWNPKRPVKLITLSWKTLLTPCYAPIDRTNRSKQTPKASVPLQSGSASAANE